MGFFELVVVFDDECVFWFDFCVGISIGEVVIGGNVVV